MTTVEKLTEATADIVADLKSLTKILKEEDRNLSVEELATVLSNPATTVVVARDNDRIVGMATLNIMPKVAGKNAYLEDVIVDPAYRGQGLGKRIVQTLIDTARDAGVSSVLLTSRPAYVEAHALYQKLGFKKKETDFFRLEL